MRYTCLLALLFLLAAACQSTDTTNETTEVTTDSRPRILLDSDANNELDDQHAIAYMLFNSDIFDIEGITINGTYNGSPIERHVEEAERIVRLCGYAGKVPILPGIDRASFDSIRPLLNREDYPGRPAIDFIIDRAKADTTRPLIVVPIGALTNVAAAITKDPSIIPHIRVVWLGSNWPDAGEYNLENDTTAVNPLLEAAGLDFEICTVRYADSTGTAAVTASVDEIRQRMPGLGPQVAPVPGRHGGSFTNFGDYSVELYEKIGDEVRSLFDVCALAILKNPEWAEATEVPAPLLVGQDWRARPDNKRTVIFWENFDREAILEDFYETMQEPMLSTGRKGE